MGTASNVVAIREKDVRPGVVGAILYWDYGGGDTDRAKLEAAWRGQGLPPENLPPPVSVREALRRAIMHVCEVPLALVRPIKLRQVEGWAVMRETHDATGRPVHTLWFSVEIRVGEMGRVLHFSPTETNRELKTKIRDRLGYELTTLTSAEIGSWLVARAVAMGAVSLRSSGGFYFLPQPQVAAWDVLRGVAHEVTSARLHEIPAMDSASAVAAIMDALSTEVKAASEAMLEEVQALTDSDPRKAQKVRNRARALTELEGKVSTYESLLGVKMEELRGNLDTLKASLAVGNVMGGAA